MVWFFPILFPIIDVISLWAFGVPDGSIVGIGLGFWAGLGLVGLGLVGLFTRVGLVLVGWFLGGCGGRPPCCSVPLWNFSNILISPWLILLDVLEGFLVFLG